MPIVYFILILPSFLERLAPTSLFAHVRGLKAGDAAPPRPTDRILQGQRPAGASINRASLRTEATSWRSRRQAAGLRAAGREIVRAEKVSGKSAAGADELDLRIRPARRRGRRGEV